jgi:hypothetical protein
MDVHCSIIQRHLDFSFQHPFLPGNSPWYSLAIPRLCLSAWPFAPDIGQMWRSSSRWLGGSSRCRMAKIPQMERMDVFYMVYICLYGLYGLNGLNIAEL